MRQILFYIPLSRLNDNWSDLPIYGYGAMLFIAFLLCNALAQRLARREGINPRFIPDLALCLFVAGITGGRIVFVMTQWQAFQAKGWLSMLMLWDGGLVLYGALFGGAAAYFGYYYGVLQRHGVSHWKLIDVLAPAIVLGIALGRIGCLFTGCCYGNVACPHCPELHFPLVTNATPPQFSSPADEMIRRGYQSAVGFLLKEYSFEVLDVEPDSNAARAGLQRGDVLVELNGQALERTSDLVRNAEQLKLKVRRDGGIVELPPFQLTSIGLHPTQIYETVSMSLLLFFLLSYYPFRQRDGELMVILMFAYAAHRYLNEALRTDTPAVAFGLTLSQNISIALVACGILLAFLVYRLPPREESRPWVEPTTETEPTSVSSQSDAPTEPITPPSTH